MSEGLERLTREVTVNTRKVHSEQTSCASNWFLSFLAVLPYLHFDSSWLNFHSDLEYLLLLFSPSVVFHCAIAWIAACQVSLSFTLYPSLLKLMSVDLLMPSNHLIVCRPLLLLPSIFPSIRVFSSELVLLIRWPKYCSFSFSISPSNESSGLISFRIGWFDLPAVQETQESSLAPQFKSINSWCSVFFFLVQFLHPYVTTGKTIASTTQTSGFFRFSFLR